MEDSASNPPPTSFQKRDALLGSSSASPAEAYQPYFEPRRGYHDTIPRPGSLHGDEGGSGQDISDFPSTSQQAALALLQDYDNGTIFAWLTGLRSLRSGSESWFHPGCLSFQQLEAISALKDCNDGLVVAWLDSARCDRSLNALPNYHRSGHVAVQSTNPTPTCNSWQGSSNTSRTSSSSFDPSASPYDTCTSASTGSSLWGRRDFPDPSREPLIDETATLTPTAGSHTHWCFICENARAFATCDGWKRHMKEHETRYPCMPHGHERHTARGPECVLCGMLNPNEKHYNSHKILPCSIKTLAARSYKRKLHLINHLKAHGVPDGSILAEQWRDTLDKKYFSCGFCIAYFHSHADQLNHIDSKHYKNHQHISDWEPSKIILGLLLQPGIRESWREMLRKNPQYNDADFRWNITAVKSLQLRLEKCEETADDLALAAFSEIIYDPLSRAQVASTPTAKLFNEHVNIYNYTMPITPPQNIPAQMFSASKQGFIYDGGMNNNPLRTQHTVWHPIPTNHSSPGVLNANPTADQKNSSQELMTKDRPQYSHNLQLEVPSSSSNDWTRPQSRCYAPYDRSDSTSSDAYGGQAASPNSLASNWNWYTSSSANPLAGHSEQVHNRNLRTGGNGGGNQPPFSPLEHTSPPLIHATILPPRNIPSTPFVPQPKQHARTKLKDHYGINTEADMDIDLDEIQYFMREEGHTRSERRRG